VLANTGARTPGIDGLTKSHLASEEAKSTLLQESGQELCERSFRPSPVRRSSLPKSTGQPRPLGLSTLTDRVVQLVLKMVLEPIWESDLLHCSHGFRPGRRTMDCLALLDSYINERHKDCWVIAGDIHAAFDSIHQTTLQPLLAQRIADPRCLDGIARFLNAGMRQGELFIRTEIGTPQGAMCSPGLANIYLHQLDLYWWTHYGSLDRKVKERRRQAYQGNGALISYADDGLVLTNGSKQEAYRRREELQAFLAEALQLQLAVEKTHVTHVNDGFHVLGFHVRRYVHGHDRPQRLVTPSDKAQQPLKTTMRDMTARRRFRETPLRKLSALNAVLRGWSTYDRYSNATAIVKDLDCWVNQRLFRWLQQRHRITAHRIMTLYKHREQGPRDNLGIQHGDAMLFLDRMSDQARTTYRSRKPQNPYLSKDWETQIESGDSPFPEHVGLGNAENNEVWREMKAQVQAERGARCERCGTTVHLDLHHRQARRYGGHDTIDNAELLCRPCHVQTPTSGDHRRLQ